MSTVITKTNAVRCVVVSPVELHFWLEGEDLDSEPQVIAIFRSHRNKANCSLDMSDTECNGIDIDSMERIVARCKRHIMKLEEFYVNYDSDLR